MRVVVVARRGSGPSHRYFPFLIQIIKESILPTFSGFIEQQFAGSVALGFSPGDGYPICRSQILDLLVNGGATVICGAETPVSTTFR